MIIRTVKSKENPYFMLNRTAADDERLSYKAVGIHTYLMSKPDNWQANESDIIKKHLDGRASVRAGIAELRKYGYMGRVQDKDAKGRFAPARIDTYECPELNPNFRGVLSDSDASDFNDDDSDSPECENRTTDIKVPLFDFLTAENPTAENRTLVINESSDIKNLSFGQAERPNDLPLQDEIPALVTEELDAPPIAPAPPAAAAGQEQTIVAAKDGKGKKTSKAAAQEDDDNHESMKRALVGYQELWNGIFFCVHQHKNYDAALNEGIKKAIGKMAKKLITDGYGIDDLRKWYGTIWLTEFYNRQGVVRTATLGRINSGIRQMRNIEAGGKPDFLEEPAKVKAVAGPQDDIFDDSGFVGRMDLPQQNYWANESV